MKDERGKGEGETKFGANGESFSPLKEYVLEEGRRRKENSTEIKNSHTKPLFLKAYLLRPSSFLLPRTANEECGMKKDAPRRILVGLHEHEGI